MKFIPFVFFILSFNFSAYSQNFKGQWKGSFSENTRENNWAGNDCDYVLEIETNGNKVSGYSYTYFTSGGVNYYTICEITGTIVPASKYVEVRETKRIKQTFLLISETVYKFTSLLFSNKRGLKALKETGYRFLTVKKTAVQDSQNFQEEIYRQVIRDTKDQQRLRQ